MFSIGFSDCTEICLSYSCNRCQMSIFKRDSLIFNTEMLLSYFLWLCLIFLIMQICMYFPFEDKL